MKIVKHEITIIPQSVEGVKFADEYEATLKEQGALRDRREDTLTITIVAEFIFEIGEKE